ncbi:MAG: efflux RND transporter periplasmic adaptor subunit [Planctomycetota bacterium]|nr:efflux RND transporter periplasmic adaptor subunit [Planctomycetota bacterium]
MDPLRGQSRIRPINAPKPRASRPLRVLLWAAPLLLAACRPATVSHADHDHEHEEEPEPVAVTVFTEKVELFMEYPRLVPGLEGRFLAHVTVLATGEPVRSGSLTLELSRPDGFSKTIEAAQPERDGLFIPVGALETPGSFDARIVVRSEQVEETIVLAPIVVYADLAAAHSASHAAAHAEETEASANAVPFLLEQQWQIGLLTEVVEARTLVRRLRVPGEVEVPTHASAVIGAPLAGRLVPPPSGELPHLGQRVEEGQIVAILEPPLSASDLAQLAANETGERLLEMELLAREIDLELKAVELHRGLLQAAAHLEFSERALARLEGLAESGLGTAAELEAARRDAEVARREHEGTRILEGAAREAIADLGALLARPDGGSDRHALRGPLRIPLASPIAGEIVEAAAVRGEHVDATATVYRVLDLSSVWLTLHVSEFDLSELPEAPGALLELAASPERTFDVLEELGGRLVHIGREVDPATRTVPVRFELSNPDGILRAGMFADVFLPPASAVEAPALPRSAVVTDRGQAVAFVLLDGETFERRVLELGIRDGEWIEVRSGVAPGERVVSSGATLVKLASANPDAFGAGHVH